MNEMKENVRQKRIDAAIAGTHTDKVPFCLHANNFYAYAYGLSMYDCMKDSRLLKEPLQKFARDFNPDFISLPIFYPADALELSQYQNVRWPGPAQNLPLDTPYQYIDSSYLDEEDYGIYLQDPVLYLKNTVFAQRFPAFAPAAAGMDFYSLCSGSIYSMAAFAAPPVKEALLKMIRTGEIVQDYLSHIGSVAASLEMMGYPTFGSAAMLCPYDAFADNVRGIMDTNIDILTDPESVMEAVKRWGDHSIPGDIAVAKQSGSKYVFMPLHCGGESFMSPEHFKEYYWPHLKRCLTALIDQGFTPIAFCEGRYTSRLDIISDVPAGKIIYIFEDVDLAKAKKTLSGIACIMAGIASQTLMYGKPEDVKEETKRILDICAPDGGFIMSNTLALDNADPKNIEVWRHATEEYGTY